MGNHGEQDGCGWQWTMQWAGQGWCEQTGALGLEWIQHAVRVPTSAVQAGPGHRGTLRMSVPLGCTWVSSLLVQCSDGEVELRTPKKVALAY